MPSPFPGMDPYLENPGTWPEVHKRLIVEIADSLNPLLLPKYYAAIDERTYMDMPEETILIGIPDVSVTAKSKNKKSENRKSENRTGDRHNSQATATIAQPKVVTLPFPEEVTEGYLEIRNAETSAVITAIEILSPKNKRKGEGRKVYLHKRQNILKTQTHLVEIDLLRAQTPMPTSSKMRSDYRILVSRSEMRPRAELYDFNLEDSIPTFPVPVKSTDADPSIDLKKLLDNIYDKAGYNFRIDYQQQPKPRLTAEQKQWVSNTVSFAV